MSKIHITLQDYQYTCGDGCCHTWGTITTVNGEELASQNQDVETILEEVLAKLGIDATVERLYDETTD